MVEYQIIHTTEYDYHQSVSVCHNIARLAIRDTTRQHCGKTVISISPEPDVIDEYLDFFRNKVVYFAIQKEHLRLRVSVKSTVTLDRSIGLMDHGIPVALWQDIVGKLSVVDPDQFDARQYVPETELTRTTDEIKDYAARSFRSGLSLYEAATDLMGRIFHGFEFSSGFTTVATPLSEMLRSRKGVCQDFAHLAIACVRSVGLPARYVSGYIETHPPEGQEKLFGVDASHAWFSVYIPGNGWIDFDPTNNVMPTDQHITIGWGRDYADVAPIKGVIQSSGPHQLTVSVDVRRLSAHADGTGY
jgi:transglutaminase-like putative cysteine protease